MAQDAIVSAQGPPSEDHGRLWDPWEIRRVGIPFLWNCAKRSTTVILSLHLGMYGSLTSVVKRKHVKQNKEIIMCALERSGLSARLMMLQGQRTVQIGDENVE